MVLDVGNPALLKMAVPDIKVSFGAENTHSTSAKLAAFKRVVVVVEGGEVDTGLALFEQAVLEYDLSCGVLVALILPVQLQVYP